MRHLLVSRVVALLAISAALITAPTPSAARPGRDRDHVARAPRAGLQRLDSHDGIGHGHDHDDVVTGVAAAPVADRNAATGGADPSQPAPIDTTPAATTPRRPDRTRLAVACPVSPLLSRHLRAPVPGRAPPTA